MLASLAMSSAKENLPVRVHFVVHESFEVPGAYERWVGDRKYASSYSEASLATWARDTKRWLAERRDVHVYFDNDAEGHAVRNALRLAELVDGRPRTLPRITRRERGPVRGSSRGDPWARR